MVRHRRMAMVGFLVVCVLASMSALRAQNAPPEDGPMLGLQSNPPDRPADNSGGVLVVGVIPGAPAEAAGVRPKDVVLKVDQKDTPDFKALQAILAGHKIGDTLELTVKRGADTLALKATLASRKEVLETERKRFTLVGQPLPPLQVSEWVNGAFDPATLAGKVVVVHFFSMVDVSSLETALPRAARWQEKFGANPDFVQVGIHSVLTAPDVQTAAKLKEFVAAQQIKFPVGVDLVKDKDALPATLLGCRMRGDEPGSFKVPGMLIVDRKGIVADKKVGLVNDDAAERLIERLLK